MHPDSATILSFLDGELDPARRGGVAAHLARCARCRAESEAVSADRELFLTLDAECRAVLPDPENEGLERVLAAIHKWQDGAGLGARGDVEFRRRVAAQLEVYFGARTAELAGAGSRERLFEALEPLFTTFLGRKAGSAALGQILAGVDQERQLAAES